VGLSIKNDEVEGKVRRLAEATGLGVTEAIDQAVTEKLARLDKVKEADIQAKLKALDAIIDKYGPFPPLDQKAIDEELYDENGLPR
jgi:antitoxin VapB